MKDLDLDADGFKWLSAGENPRGVEITTGDLYDHYNNHSVSVLDKDEVAKLIDWLVQWHDQQTEGEVNK